MDDLAKYFKKDISVDQLEAELPWIGLDLEDKGSDWVKVEYNPNRPDYSSPEGIIRSLLGRMDIATGYIPYQTKPSGFTVTVNESISNIRPYIVMAIIRDVELTEDNLSSIMNMQEDLHWAVGRDRKKAAIGLHDFDATTPPYRYFAADPDQYTFEPLQGQGKMSLRDIIRKHPKGQKYKHLVEPFNKFPLIVDATDRVLSFPPIINGTMTQVTSETRNFLVDITGPSKEAITSALNILVTTFADQGKEIESLKIEYPTSSETTPDLSPQKMTLNVPYANSILGLTLSAKDIIKALRRCRFDGVKVSKDQIEVLIPPYRVDILHEVGLVEEVAIGYGIDKLSPTMPKTLGYGSAHPHIELAYRLRELMIGFGYQELITYTISNNAFKTEKVYDTEPGVKLMSPMSSEYDVLRTSMLPNILQVLVANKHYDLPHRVFEIGDTVHIDKKLYNRTYRQMTVGAASLHNEAGFTEVKAAVERILHELNLNGDRITYTPLEHPRYISGRGANILFEGKTLGHMGELHPQVLSNVDLEFPCAYFELNLEVIL